MAGALVVNNIVKRFSLAPLHHDRLTQMANDDNLEQRSETLFQFCTGL